MSITALNRLLRVYSIACRMLWPLAYTVDAIHELGHLQAFRQLGTGGQWKLAIGCRLDDDNPARVQLGRELTGQLWMSGFGELAPQLRRRVLLGGPVATWLWAVVCLIVTMLWTSVGLPAGEPVAAVMTVWALLGVTDTMVNMLEVSWSDGMASDGLQLAGIRAELRERQPAAVTA